MSCSQFNRDFNSEKIIYPKAYTFYLAYFWKTFIVFTLKVDLLSTFSC